MFFLEKYQNKDYCPFSPLLISFLPFMPFEVYALATIVAR